MDPKQRRFNKIVAFTFFAANLCFVVLIILFVIFFIVYR